MNGREQSDACKGCAISRRDGNVELVRKIEDCGGILQLKYDWVLHHYTGSEGFLGWLALQPREHRGGLDDLTNGESEGFGVLLKAIEESLRAYWQEEFPNDPLERVYIACFYESSKHLHLHIVPRPESFKDIRFCTEACSEFELIEKESRWAYGWHVYLASRCDRFPDTYRRDKEKAQKLMGFLGTRLPLA